MADALFDTTVFIDYYRGDEGARSLMLAVMNGVMTASYSPLTAFEIWMGVASHEEEADYTAMLAFVEEARLTTSAAKTAASWLRGTTPRRAEMLFRDALIEASAAERGEPVYTRNVADFSRLYSRVQTY